MFLQNQDGQSSENNKNQLDTLTCFVNESISENEDINQWISELEFNALELSNEEYQYVKNAIFSFSLFY